MGKVFFAVVAFVASLILVESLTCNKCTFAVLGVCLNKASETCETNTSVCFTGRTMFMSLTSVTSFSTQGCKDNNTDCEVTTNNTLLGVTYERTLTCCSTDKCNPVTISHSDPSYNTWVSKLWKLINGIFSANR